MADRLRDLLDLVLASLDDRADGVELARRAAFSRDHLDRLLAAATGETPIALRRRLLLERAAWQLRGGAAVADVAGPAGYGSAAAFTRAFGRAYGRTPTAFVRVGAPVDLPAPNGIHFHPPAGLLLPRGRDASPAARRAPAPVGDLTERLLRHHLERSRDLLALAAALRPADRERPLRPGLVVMDLEGPEPSAGLMAERLVGTLEVWTAALAGEEEPAREGPLLSRFDAVAPAFAAHARRIRDDGAWDDAFVDALCEPPQAFTYGGVLAHVLTYGAVRREALAAVLAELGAPVPDTADPILWEQGLRR
ncbi:AraC family transcriptional regulator [Patulibacter sp. SYSU D01012]|uniref:helix-turn-helix domain-containing protein n=1 Tax=Patulibacter sp. SYSU D01012 TaxID=2817381 RepID=UPI001B3184D9